MMRVLWRLRLAWKRWRALRAFVPAFCKRCGRDVHDFVVDAATWARVRPALPGNVACYDCFAAACETVGLPSVWRLDGAA